MERAAQGGGGGRGPLRRIHWLSFALYPLLSFFSPSEPWLFDYLVSKGFSAAQLVGDVFPVWTYSLFACLPLVLASSKLVGHKWTVVLGAIARLAAAAIVLVVPAGDVRLMQLDQVCFSIFFVAKTTVLPALLFEVLEPRNYQRAIALMRGCVLIGSASSSLASQLLLSRSGSRAGLDVLVRATFWSHLGGLCASLTLPAQSRARTCAHCCSRCGRRSGEQGSEEDVALRPRSPLASPRRALASLRRALAQQRGSRLLVLLVWHVALCALQQLMLTYWQALFADLASPGAGDAPLGWNGLVLGLSYLAASLTSVLAALRPCERLVRRWTGAVATGSSAAAALLLAALGSRSIPARLPLGLPQAYLAFTLAQALFELTRTLSLAQLALALHESGARHFLSALVTCQLLISAMQAALQLAIRRASADAPRHFELLAAFAAAVAVSLAALTLCAARQSEERPSLAGTVVGGCAVESHAPLSCASHHDGLLCEAEAAEDDPSEQRAIAALPSFARVSIVDDGPPLDVAVARRLSSPPIYNT